MNISIIDMHIALLFYCHNLALKSIGNWNVFEDVIWITCVEEIGVPRANLSAFVLPFMIIFISPVNVMVVQNQPNKIK